LAKFDELEQIGHSRRTFVQHTKNLAEKWCVYVYRARHPAKCPDEGVRIECVASAAPLQQRE
jgi:hypothetical protein